MSMAAVAIGTTAVAVAGAATAAGMQASAAGKAAKAQGAAAKAAARKEKKALKGFTKGQQQIEADLGQVQMPVFSPGQDISVAGDISDFYRRQQELALGPNAALGRQEAYELGRQQLAELARMTAGEYSQADIDRLQRTAAESGIPINIQTAGKGMGVPQVGQANFLRNLGMLPIEYKQLAFQYAPQVQNTMMGWVGAARNFLTAEPLDVSRTSLAYQMGAANVGLEKVGIKSNLIAAQYGAQTGQAQRGYARQQENIGASLAARQAAAQGIGDTTAAIGQAGIAGYGMYNQIDTAKGAELLGGITSGYGGKQYAPQTSATGGQYYAPIGSKIYG